MQLSRNNCLFGVWIFKDAGVTVHWTTIQENILQRQSITDLQQYIVNEAI